ncbi:MAG TPA: apolipoprotein N-acyltransferase [Nocardioidaceae bacterium]|nr:apolipoprotein N-acyltransferase [Nocardioidaceae bacterium]
MHPLLRVGLAAALGVCLALAMPPLGWWPLALVAVGGLALMCHHVSMAKGALAGSVFGFTFMLVCMWWLHVVVPGIQFAIAVAEVPFFALLGLSLAATSRLPAWPLWGASAWVAMEVLRGNVPFGGFPWARLGTAFVDTPVVGWSRYLGEGGLTLVVALASILLAASVVCFRRWAVVHARRWAAASAGAAVALLAAAALLPVGLAGPGGRTLTVAVVQGDVPGKGLNSFSEPRVTLRNHVEATRELAADVDTGRVPAPDVVIWPENASDIDPLRYEQAGALIQQAVDAVAAPVVVGAVTLGPGPNDVQGTGIVWQPSTGPADHYAKHKLVPFGEWVPFRAALTPLIPLLESEIPRDFVPGTRPGVLDVGELTVGAVMCFEVAYDAAIRDVTRGTVDLLAVQTNNATYLGTDQLEQQWAITRMRAVETGRAVAVAATTGISGVIAPDGEVVERTESRAQQVIVAEVPAAEGTTLGVRIGAAVATVSTVVAGLATLTAVIVLRRRRETLRVR